MSGVKAPDNFIDMTCLFMVSAALQRRVWMGGCDDKGRPLPGTGPLFANQYMTIVAPPGVGKDLCLREVSDIFKELSIPLAKGETTVEGDEYLQVDSRHMENSKKKKGKFESAQLFPMAPDSTTFEDLVFKHARSVGSIDYTYGVDDEGKPQNRKYLHNSMMFVLSELANVAKKNAANTINYMNQAFDCGTYHNSTKGRGEDLIKDSCLTILAATQPDFLKRAFSDALLNEGFLSRTLLIYADRNRFKRFWMPIKTKEQLSGREAVIIHVKFLATLYGNIVPSQEVHDYMQNWIMTEDENRVNKSPKLEKYYVRKSVQLQKLAMAIHFSKIPTGMIDDTTFDIKLESFKEAIAVLDVLEENMHLCLKSATVAGPLSNIEEVEKWIITNPGQGFLPLFADFMEVLQPDELRGLLESLKMAGRITSTEDVESASDEQKWYPLTVDPSLQAEEII
jgi:hypothetical protein